VKRILMAFLVSATLGSGALASALGAFSGTDDMSDPGGSGSPCMGPSAAGNKSDYPLGPAIRDFAKIGLVPLSVHNFQAESGLDCRRP
jgi:hypothetical protein